MYEDSNSKQQNPNNKIRTTKSVDFSSIVRTTLGVEAAMARMDPVPGGRMASNCWTPNIPRLEMVKVPRKRKR